MEIIENLSILALFGIVCIAVSWMIIISQKRVSTERKTAKRNDERDQALKRAGIDPLSGELIHDHVSLEKATFLKHEKYLLAECDDELLKRAKETRKPIKLGYFWKEKWTRGLPFYIFFCPSCNNPAVDYKHGHRPYLSCRICEIDIRFSVFGVTNP